MKRWVHEEPICEEHGGLYEKGCPGCRLNAAYWEAVDAAVDREREEEAFPPDPLEEW